MSASDRFQLVAQPAHEPARDIVTGSTVGPFIDAGAWIQPAVRRQRVYLSVDTVKALAEAAGITQPVMDEATIAKLRAEGALDFLKENLHGDLVRSLQRLAHFLDDADVAGDPGAPEGAGDAGADER